MLETAKHKNHFTCDGFWNEKWHINLHCRNKSSRSTPSVNQERDAVLSTLMWTRCLLWSVSKNTPSFWGLNSYDHAWCELMGCLKWAGHRSHPPRSSTLCQADGHKGWVHPCFKVYMKLKVDVQMKWRNKQLKARERNGKQKIVPFPAYTFFPRVSFNFALPRLAFYVWTVSDLVHPRQHLCLI